MPTRSPATLISARNHAIPLLKTALHTHQNAKAQHYGRTAIKDTRQDVATAITIARTLGHTWASVNAGTGLDRKTQQRFLNSAFKGQQGTVPNATRAARHTKQDHKQAGDTLFNTIAQDIWMRDEIRQAVAHGVHDAVRDKLADILTSPRPLAPHDFPFLAARLEHTHHRAAEAAIYVIAYTRVDTTYARIAEEARQAAASV